MTWKILIPEEARPYLELLPPETEPVLYRVRSEAISRRIRRRLGFTVDADPLVVKMEVAGSAADLEAVEAVWLSARLRLSQEEMEGLLERLPLVRWVYSQRTGLDHLNLRAFEQRGVALSNTGTLVSAWAAQMVFACIMTQAKRLPAHWLQQRRHGQDTILCEDFTRQSVLVVGTGAIGEETARFCKAVGLRVEGASRSPGEKDSENYDAVLSLHADLDAALARADYVVLSLPLTDETRGFMNARRLSSLGSGACLINLARAELVEEAALLAWLDESAARSAYLSKLGKTTLWRRWRALRRHNLHLTHGSDAHLSGKTERATAQFADLLKQFMATGRVDQRVV